MNKKRFQIGAVHVLHMRAIAGLLCAVVCAALIYAGLSRLTERGGAQLDLTSESLSTLSEGTELTLDALEQPLTLHLVFQSSTQSELRTRLETLAASYARMGNITVDTIDPIAEPGRISPYQSTGQSIEEGAIVVANAAGTRFQVVPAREMYTYKVNSSGAYQLTGISAEQKLTAAVRSVSGVRSVRVYFLSGHEEAGVSACSSLVSRLEQENYTVSDLTLGKGTTLEAGDVLVVLSPLLDLTQEEYALVDAFMQSGGRLLFACDASIDLTQMPHFGELASRLSLSFEQGIVVEDERMADYWMNSPLYLMPVVSETAQATAALKSGGRVIMPGARAVSGPAMPLSGYTYETLVATSDQAYIKRTDSEAFSREAGDPTGMQQLAVSVMHQIEGTDASMRAVLMGTLYTLVNNGLLESTYNLDLSVQLIGFLAEREDTISVPVRTVADTSMAIPSALAAFKLLGITLCLPLLAAITGVCVMVRRRRR